MSKPRDEDGDGDDDDGDGCDDLGRRVQHLIKPKSSEQIDLRLDANDSLFQTSSELNGALQQSELVAKPSSPDDEAVANVDAEYGGENPADDVGKDDNERRVGFTEQSLVSSQRIDKTRIFTLAELESRRYFEEEFELDDHLWSTLIRIVRDLRSENRVDILKGCKNLLGLLSRPDLYSQFFDVIVQRCVVEVKVRC